jgi:hypothetical protein
LLYASHWTRYGTDDFLGQKYLPGVIKKRLFHFINDTTIDKTEQPKPLSTLNLMDDWSGSDYTDHKTYNKEMSDARREKKRMSV